MTKKFAMIKTSGLFLAHNMGVQIARDAHCAHGQDAVLLILFGQRGREGAAQRLDTMMPRCVLTEMLGALQAQILRDEGEDALRQFHDEIATATQQSTAALEQLHVDERDCCEAGFHTHGAEHTCGRHTTEEGPTP